MGFFTGVAKLALPLLTMLGVFGTLKFASENGTFDMIQRGLDSRTPDLPNSSIRLKTHWTGFQPVDGHLAFVTSFFWPTVDGKMPNLTMQGIHFLGQLSSIYIILMLESFRVGNHWKLISFMTITGLLIENVAMAIILPLWCFLHLLTSPTASSPSSQSLSLRKTAILVHPVELTVLPWSTLIGHGVPAVLMFVLKPSAKLPFYYSQQFWIAARLFHPVFTSMLQLIFSMFSRVADVGFATAEQRNRNVLRSLQRVYSFATYVAVIPHIGIMSLLFASRFAPQMIASGYKSLLDGTLLFSPVRFWEDPLPTASNVGHGALMLLQWDELVSCLAILIWAFALHRQAVSQETGFWSTVFSTFAMFVVGGPAAAAISLLKERDQIVLDKTEDSEKKQQ